MSTGVVFIELKSQWSLSMSYFATVSQQMLTAIKHVTTGNFVLQQDSALVHHSMEHSPTAGGKTLNFTFLICLLYTSDAADE